MLSEMRDTVPMVMRGMGVNMEDATKDDWLAAIDKLERGGGLRVRSGASPATSTPRT